MAKEKEKKQSDKTALEKLKEIDKATSTAFILMFPALIIAVIAIYYAPLVMAMITIGIAVYQFLMLRQFISDYYKRK